MGRHGLGVGNEDITLASNLDIPEVAKAKNKKDALKALFHHKQKEKNAALAEAFNAQENGKDDHYILYHGDAITRMGTFRDELFDMILTDPPYGVGAHTFGDQTFRPRRSS